MRLSQWTFTPWGICDSGSIGRSGGLFCISDHSVGSSPITSLGNSLKTCKLISSALFCDLCFTCVLPRELFPFHFFGFFSCWLAWMLALTLELFPTPLPHASEDFIHLYHMYLFSSLFFMLNSLYRFVIRYTEAVLKLWSCFMCSEFHLLFYHLCHVIRALYSSLLSLYLTFTLMVFILNNFLHWLLPSPWILSIFHLFIYLGACPLVSWYLL